MPEPGFTRFIHRKKTDEGWRYYVRGSEVRVIRIVRLHEEGWAIEEIREDYPELSVHEIQATLKYYYKYAHLFRRKPAT